MELLPNYYAWTYGAFRPFLSGEVIELGCGAGLGIASYHSRVDRVYAVDHNEDLLRRVQANFPRDRVRTILADLAGDWSELQGLSVDSVILMDVLEHFRDDLTFLRKAADLLKPGGHVLLKVPAQSRLYSPMDRASGHFRRYDPKDVETLASSLGLRIVKLNQINRLGALAYRVKNHNATNFSKSFAPLQLKIINLALPLVRLFDVLPRLPGLSLVAALAKCPQKRAEGNGTAL
jgi:SAM-dependent methyltransferase